MNVSLKDNTTTHQTRTTIPHRGMGVSGTDVLITKINNKNSMSDQHLVSPDSNNTESFIKITRIKVMMANKRSFDH